jgi:hypothetical protein
LRVEPLEDRSVPATITPTTFADGGLGSGSLRDAVLQFNADSGTEDDTIQLLAGTYTLTIKNAGGVHETAGLTGDLNLTSANHHWIIQGAGPSTIIDASQLQDRVFQIVKSGTQVVFQDLVIQGGLAQENGGDGVHQGSTDALGGGILNNGGDLTLNNVVLQNNSAKGGDGASLGEDGHNARGGGLYSSGGPLTISGSSLTNNQTTGGMGGGGTGTILYFPGAGGNAQGGGLYSSSGMLTVSHSSLAGNRVTGGNPGIAGLLLSGGGSAQGGGLYATGGSLTFADSTAGANTLRGGDGFPAGASQGGGLYIGGTATVNNATIIANTLRGGDAYGFGSDSPGGASQGGGLYVDGTATVNNVAITANALRGGDGYPGGVSQGGGLYLSGVLVVSNSTIAANSSRGGDGLYNGYFGLGGNGGPGEGGGASVAAGATAQVSFSTLAGNQATGGTRGIQNASDGPATGGGVNNQGLLETRDTLLADNTVNGPGTNTSPDLAGNLGSLGHNLVGNSQGGSGFDSTDLLNVNPLLGPLQNNGGPTETMALLPGSPAIDAGDNTGAPDWDQRGPGYPRIVNGIIDIGAFEYQGDGSGPSANGEAHGRPILAAVVFDPPRRADFTPILSSATFPGQAIIASVTGGVAPRWEEVSVPSAIVVDPRLASVHEKAQGPMAALGPDPGPLQWSWPNPDLFPQEAGLAR